MLVSHNQLFDLLTLTFNKLILNIDDLRVILDNFIFMVYIFLKAKFIREVNTYTYIECYIRLIE